MLPHIIAETANTHLEGTMNKSEEHTYDARELYNAIVNFANLNGESDPDTLKRYTTATFRTAAKLLEQLEKQGT